MFADSFFADFLSKYKPMMYEYVGLKINAINTQKGLLQNRRET